MQSYDIAVIGAGAGGLVAVGMAHRRGAKVALIEKNKIGGECTHSGCIPSKTIINVAKTFHAMGRTASLGLPPVEASTELDLAQVMAYVNSVIQGIYEHEKPQVYRDMGIDVYIHPSGAQFLDNRRIRVGDDVVDAAHTIISTGSSPKIPNIVGHEPFSYFTNENFWQITGHPAEVIFLGGGVIAAELGQVMARFGCGVTIVDRNPRILKVVDQDVGDVAIEVLKGEGIRVLTNTEVTSCQGAPGRNQIIYLKQDGEQRTLETDAVLFAAMGRVPNVRGLDLERAGVAYDARRGIKTNEYLQTTAPNIYACGDVTTRLKFTHTASFQAEVCTRNILYGNDTVNDLSILPWAIFMDPEVAHVGLSEREARDKYEDVQVFRVNATVDRFITDGKTTGLLKVVMDQNDRILGADAIGAHSGEWIQFITVALKNKLPITSFADTIFAYPTFSEIVKKAFTRFLRTKL